MNTQYCSICNREHVGSKCSIRALRSVDAAHRRTPEEIEETRLNRDPSFGQRLSDGFAMLYGSEQ